MLGNIVGLLTILLHRPPREAAAVQVGDSSSFSVEDRESRWAGRSQALQQFEELKMSVILCTGMFCGVFFLWTSSCPTSERIHADHFVCQRGMTIPFGKLALFIGCY